MLWHLPKIEALCVCSAGVQTAGTGTEQIYNVAEPVEVNTQTRAKPISSVGVTL